jgi:hypothetical protein
MFKIQATNSDGTEIDVDKLLRGGNSFDTEDAAQAVADAFERGYQKFSVTTTADGKFEVSGVFSVFANTPTGPVETVNQVTMRSVLEPCVFDDKAVADLHVERLNEHFSAPEYEVVPQSTASKL